MTIENFLLLSNNELTIRLLLQKSLLSNVRAYLSQNEVKKAYLLDRQTSHH